MDIAEPESVGFSSARLDTVEQAWKTEIANKSFPGAVTLIARKGKVIYHRAVGHMDAAQTTPMRLDAVFNIASLTKPVVSVATLMLLEKGRIKLSDPIGVHLKEFAKATLKTEVVSCDKVGNLRSELISADRPVTVQDLMRHTSGFAYSERQAGPLLRKAYIDGNIEARVAPSSAEDMLRNLAEAPLADHPGMVFRYSISTDVLGLLLERVLDKPLDAILREMVLSPLGMNDTGFAMPPKNRQPEFFAEEPGREAHLRNIALNGHDGTSYFKGGSGLMSTVMDYFRFTSMLFNNGRLDGVRLLSPKTVELMTSDHLEGMERQAYAGVAPMVGPGYGFGLGVAVRITKGVSYSPGSIGDYTWGGSRGHIFTTDPAEQLTGIFMSYGAVARLHTRQVFKNLIYGAVEATETTA